MDKLKSKKIGFVSKSSTSGYKFPLAYLREKKIDVASFFLSSEFLGDHSQVTDAIARGTIDVGTTWDVNLSLAEEKHGPVFARIAEYGPITNHALAGHHALPLALHSKIVELITMLPKEVTSRFCQN